MKNIYLTRLLTNLLLILLFASCSNNSDYKLTYMSSSKLELDPNIKTLAIHGIEISQSDLDFALSFINNNYGTSVSFDTEKGEIFNKKDYDYFTNQGNSHGSIWIEAEEPKVLEEKSEITIEKTVIINDPIDPSKKVRRKIIFKNPVIIKEYSCNVYVTFIDNINSKEIFTYHQFEKNEYALYSTLLGDDSTIVSKDIGYDDSAKISATIAKTNSQNHVDSFPINKNFKEETMRLALNNLLESIAPYKIENQVNFMKLADTQLNSEMFRYIRAKDFTSLYSFLQNNSLTIKKSGTDQELAYHYNLAYSHEIMGNLKAAISEMEKAYSTKPEDHIQKEIDRLNKRIKDQFLFQS